MKKEIGGYIELECTGHGFDFYHDLLKLNSARNAFAYVLRRIKPSKVYLPYYLCSCIRQTCKSEGVEIEFYHIDANMIPILPNSQKNGSLLYIVNYYGQIKKRIIKKYKRRFRHIVLDNVQAFFSKPIKDIYTIYSCRKFFGVPDGGYLSNVCSKSLNLDEDCSKERFTHLVGRLNSDAQSFYNDFLKNEAVIDSLPVLKMSKETDNIMSAIDYKSVRRIREKNCIFLNKHLKIVNNLKFRRNSGPYCYPFLVKNGAHLRTMLVNNRIYIPLLWPNIRTTDLSDVEKNLVYNLVILPCDQRYSLKEMKYICDMILNYVKE